MALAVKAMPGSRGASRRQKALREGAACGPSYLVTPQHPRPILARPKVNEGGWHCRRARCHPFTCLLCKPRKIAPADRGPTRGAHPTFPLFPDPDFLHVATFPKRHVLQERRGADLQPPEGKS